MIIERIENRDRRITVSVGTAAIYVDVDGSSIRLTVEQVGTLAEALGTAADALETP